MPLVVQSLLKPALIKVHVYFRKFHYILQIIKLFIELIYFGGSMKISNMEMNVMLEIILIINKFLVANHKI